MRTLLLLLDKEFRQIFRDPIMPRLIFLFPVLQLLVLPLASDFEIKNIQIAVVDHDRSSYSTELTRRITASGYFVLTSSGDSYNEAFRLIESDRADLVLEVPAGFEEELRRDRTSSLFLAVNAINGTKANVGGAYVSRIIGEFNQHIRLEGFTPPAGMVRIEPQNWYNPHQDYARFMVPGFLVMMVTMIAAYLTALNIVKEKEIGTIEQINVTPIPKSIFILGKLIPFWIIGNMVFTLGLFLVARVVYGIIPEGSTALLYAYLSVYLMAILGIGLLISTYSSTQQQAMSLAFFVMMIFLLMSGLFTSIESMPAWAQVIAWLNPLTYFVDVIRMLVLRGSGFSDIATHFAATAGFALFYNSWAIWNYRKTA